jgi:hypothetical protein
MSYRIAQDFEYIGNDYWRWWAWIEGDGDKLDDVKEVVWILHPSFKRTRVSVKDRSTGFRLDASGWGTFLLRAEVVLKDGEKRPLRRNLKLEYPESTSAAVRSKEQATAPAGSPQTVFLSYSGQDARIAARLREELKKIAGIEVLDMSRVNVGEPLSEAVQRMISKSDAVIGIVGEDEVSPFVIDELRVGVAAAKPSGVLLPEGNSGMELPDSVERLQFDTVAPSALRVAEFLKGRSRFD